MKQGKLVAALFTQKHERPDDTLGFMSCEKRGFTSGVKTPRQTASDRKWEGAAWISPEQLASSVDKRPRRKFPLVAASSSTSSLEKKALTTKSVGVGVAAKKPDADSDADADTDVAFLHKSTKEPVVYSTPRPPEPTNGKDAVGRRRDKDKIPASTTWEWQGDPATGTWVEVARPRFLEVGIFFSYSPIPSKQVVLLEWLHVGSKRSDASAALNADFLRTHLIPRLNRTHPVSLRLLDWLVVDYAREKGIAYRRFFPHLGQYRLVVVYSLYFEWLTRWRRRHYDVFRRRHRIYFTLDNQTYSTTVAQLHFFYMAELYGFLDFAQENAKDIEAHMQSKLGITNAIKRKASESGETYRRRPLVSKCPPKAYIAEGECTLTFKINSDRESDSESNTDAETDIDNDEDDGYGENEDDLKKSDEAF